MRVALVQSASLRGDVVANVAHHVEWIERAAGVGAQLVAFPELSLTGYELDLVAVAPSLTVTEDDPRLEPIRRACAAAGITAVVGAPALLDGRRRLAAVVIDGESTRSYAKRRLFGREADVFTPGTEPLVLTFGDVRVALGVCADLGAAGQVDETARLEADAWVLGSLVSAEGYELEAQQAADAAGRIGGVVAFANHAAPTGGWTPAGRSAAWREGSRLAAAEGRDESLVVFELTARETRRPPSRHD
ncbi:carbon-nitrogen hydrolase family protein [Aeromicrobium phragmitis]|uniref:carbon-nitrogen hydrolase family protein n=1 Tax=Aeromicrobium phragmitis TaxID=2478914 RepID=UPI00140723D9|nr:carbon-nitrogen hydrolase family protein [Aeromicrobium phragmitis]